MPSVKGGYTAPARSFPGTEVTAIKTVLDAGIVAGAGGGIEKSLIAGAKYHSQAGYRSVVALVHPSNDSSFELLRTRAKRSGVELLDRGEVVPFSLLTLAWFARICRQHRVSIWHGHDYKTDLVGLLLQPIFKFSLVSTLHGWSERTSRTSLYFAIDRQVVRRYDQVVAVSSELHQAAQRLGIPDGRLSLIENGVDTVEYQRRGTAVAASGALHVGAAGRLTPEKGFLVLIDAIEALLDEGLSLRLSIAGEGPQRADLAQRIQASRYRDRFALRGYLDDMPAFYESLDVFCLSSLREGLPNVVLEAMSMSLPIVATTAGGLSTFLRNGTDALCCDPGSVSELRDALRALACSPELRQQLARISRARVVAECSFAGRMARLFAVYDHLATPAAAT